MTATEAEVTVPGTGTPKLNKALSQLQGELPQITKTKTGKVKGQDTAGSNSHTSTPTPTSAMSSPTSGRCWPSTASRSTARPRSTRPTAAR